MAYKFKNNYNFYDIFDNQEFPNECWNLKFEMDCGNSFIDKYGSNATTYVGLKEILIKIEDINVLGSGIFSQWRYFNHWAEVHPNEEEINWFILALNILADLTKDPIM